MEYALLYLPGGRPSTTGTLSAVEYEGDGLGDVLPAPVISTSGFNGPVDPSFDVPSSSNSEPGWFVAGKEKFRPSLDSTALDVPLLHFVLQLSSNVLQGLHTGLTILLESLLSTQTHQRLV
jgi:hypothetical protein